MGAAPLPLITLYYFDIYVHHFAMLGPSENELW